jgi:uncharacterized protein (DUF2147 family)
MKSLILVSIISIATVFKTIAQNNSDLIIGRWLSADKTIEIEIYKCQNKFDGKIIWLDDSNNKRPINTRMDKHNPNPALQTRKLIGLVVLNGLVYNDENGDWEGGKIYNPHTGKQLDAKASLTNEGYLDVRGYITLEFLGKDLLFKKVL